MSTKRKKKPKKQRRARRRKQEGYSLGPGDLYYAVADGNLT